MYNMRTAKKLACLMLASTLVVASGCSKSDDPLMAESKESLVNMVNEMNTELNDNYTRIAELEELLKGVQGEESPEAGIVEIGDGTGRLTFTSVNDTIKLPVEFVYPGSQQAPSTSSVNISEAISIRPTSNWTVKVSGTKIELYHSSGVSGVITVGTLDREAQKTQAADLQEHLNTFFSKLPPETIKYNRIYLDDYWCGMDAISHTFIDSADAMIRCGLFGYGEVSGQYMFVYTGSQDAAKDEVILSLVKTMKVWNSNISIQ